MLLDHLHVGGLSGFYLRKHLEISTIHWLSIIFEDISSLMKWDSDSHLFMMFKVTELSDIKGTRKGLGQQKLFYEFLVWI